MLQPIPTGPDSWRVSDDFVNFYMVRVGTHMLFFDSGASGPDLGELAASQGCEKGILFVTHADGDHLSGVTQFHDFFIHPADISRAKHLVPGSVPRGMENGHINEVVSPFDRARRIELIHVGGHTPGSAAYLDRNARALYCGDVIARNAPMYLFGEGRDIPGLISGLEALYARRRAYSRIYPGHGDVPLTAKDIPPVIQACQKYLRGELTPRPPLEDLPCQLYQDGDVMLYI